MKPVVVITGANRGIGLSFCRLYAQQGANVYAVCRQSNAELETLPVQVISGIDIADGESIETLSAQLAGIRIDLLINNAGILRYEELGQINRDSIEQQFQTNALGPLCVTDALADRLAHGSKVAMITSRMGSIADNTSGGRYGYRMSKAALNIASVSLAHDLRPRGIAVAILHPGLVGTDMIGGYGDITPDEAAARLAQRIDALNLDNSGSFWHSNGDQLPW